MERSKTIHIDTIAPEQQFGALRHTCVHEGWKQLGMHNMESETCSIRMTFFSRLKPTELSDNAYGSYHNAEHCDVLHECEGRRTLIRGTVAPLELHNKECDPASQLGQFRI